MALIPSDLLAAFREKRVAVFVGAGASVAAGAPTWRMLVGALAAELNIEPDGKDGNFSTLLLTAIPQYYENANNRTNLLSKISKPFQALKSSSRVHDLLANLPCDLFYTTNFDRLLEDALQKNRGRKPEVISNDLEAKISAGKRECQVRKIHGTLGGEIVITREDFAQYSINNPVQTDLLMLDLMTLQFLFVGYSLSDPDFNSIYNHSYFRMKPMNQQHFLTLEQADKHETADLKSRGFQVLNLEEWEGDSSSTRLIRFLSELCEETSDAMHVSRVFSGLDEGQKVPIVVPARIHRSERYPFYPTMDRDAASSIAASLSLGRASGFTFPDRKLIPEGSYAESSRLPLLSQAEDFLAQDVILVGSPRGNLLTKYFFEHAADQFDDPSTCPITTQFRQGLRTGRYRSLTDGATPYVLKAKDHSRSRPRPGVTNHEYALVARYRNPWAEGSFVFVFAGIWAMGTQAIADFFDNPKNCKNLPWKDMTGRLENRKGGHGRTMITQSPDIAILDVSYSKPEAAPDEYDEMALMEWIDTGLAPFPGTNPIKNPRFPGPD